jgi:hypothetical protein
MWVVGKRLPPAALPPEREPVPILQEARWVLGPYWRGAENLPPAGIWSHDHAALGESLYLMSCPGSLKIYKLKVHEAINGLVHLVHELSTDFI